MKKNVNFDWSGEKDCQCENLEGLGLRPGWGSGQRLEQGVGAAVKEGEMWERMCVCLWREDVGINCMTHPMRIE